jgi:hypothetical protein
MNQQDDNHDRNVAYAILSVPLLISILMIIIVQYSCVG